MAITDDLCHITNSSVIQDDLGNAKGAAIAFIFFMTEPFCRAGRQARAAYGQKNKMGKASVHHEIGAFDVSSASASCDWSPSILGSILAHPLRLVGFCLASALSLTFFGVSALLSASDSGVRIYHYQSASAVSSLLFASASLSVKSSL